MNLLSGNPSFLWIFLLNDPDPQPVAQTCQYTASRLTPFSTKALNQAWTFFYWMLSRHFGGFQNLVHRHWTGVPFCGYTDFGGLMQGPTSITLDFFQWEPCIKWIDWLSHWSNEGYSRWLGQEFCLFQGGQGWRNMFVISVWCDKKLIVCYLCTPILPFWFSHDSYRIRSYGGFPANWAAKKQTNHNFHSTSPGSSGTHLYASPSQGELEATSGDVSPFHFRWQAVRRSSMEWPWWMFHLNEGYFDNKKIPYQTAQAI